jgi:hypothetical protein
MTMWKVLGASAIALLGSAPGARASNRYQN